MRHIENWIRNILMKTKAKFSGQDLCKECGLCCTSFFSKGFVADEKEMLTVIRFGGEVFIDSDGEQCFYQPCPGYNERCSVYPNHPLACKHFECRLLKKLLRGEIAQEEALALVIQMKEAVVLIDNSLLSLFGKREGTTIKYMQQFFNHAKLEYEEHYFKQDYAHVMEAHAVYMWLRKQHFDNPE